MTGWDNIVRHFAELGWMGAAYELHLLIRLFGAIFVGLPLTHLIMDRLEFRGAKP